MANYPKENPHAPEVPPNQRGVLKSALFLPQTFSDKAVGFLKGVLHTLTSPLVLLPALGVLTGVGANRGWFNDLSVFGVDVGKGLNVAGGLVNKGISGMGTL